MDNETQENEQILAAMVRYLFESGKTDSAKALLSTELVDYAQISQTYRKFHNETYTRSAWRAILRGSTVFIRRIAEKETALDDEDSEPYQTNSQLYFDVQEAFDAVVMALEGPTEIVAKLELSPVETDWRAMMLAEIETDKPTNQGYVFAKKENVIIHEGQKFSSLPEVAIAKALDKAGVMYFPNCLVRVGLPGMKRENKYPDFLITHKGKWGILEVDGQTYHTPTNATKDHERSRALEQHGGIKYFTRYDAQRCMKEPDKVVAEFLRILETK
jgi:hypothetical protein